MQISRTLSTTFGQRGSLLGVGEALKREIAGLGWMCGARVMLQPFVFLAALWGVGLVLSWDHS